MKKINIFLVDDHALFREGLRFLLQKMDFVDQILDAKNGAEFLEKVVDVKDCIVLMDIEMPVMNGNRSYKKGAGAGCDLENACIINVFRRKLPVEYDRSGSLRVLT
jgi:DNA-binding NarL/FixJ family response regulator